MSNYLEDGYERAIAYIESLERFGIRLGLDSVAALLERLGNPHLVYKTIHVTGTNGKGSVVSFCSSILTSAGFRTGKYVSPHLSEFTERISIDGSRITKEEVAMYFEVVRKEAEALNSKGIVITYFEFVTALAFLYFMEKKVYFAVVEAGMGGRLDATNVI